MICIYHGDCADGFTAATIVKHNFPKCKMFKGVHGDSPPNVTNEKVIIVDFSYKRDVLIEMAKDATSILILDHHKSAEKDLLDLPQHNIVTLFDMEMSGAGLTWQYFHPTEEMPMFVQHVQDRDLWKFEIPWSKEFSAGLFSLEYDFDMWDTLIYDSTEDDINQLLDAGTYIMQKQTKDIKELIANSMYYKYVDIYLVPHLNVPYMYASEAGSLMAIGESFAVTYYDTAATTNFSLRSTDEGIDVSEIATQFGGGGHRNAAGFKVPR